MALYLRLVEVTVRRGAGMRILVTGGSGVIGQPLLVALLGGGYDVRLLARQARAHAREWPPGVEPWPGDVSDAQSITGAADDCAAVIHVAGIAEEHPPDTTFQRVNVEGTRHILAEAERAAVRRFVYVSSLGADRGKSRYHQSKRSAEALVAQSSTDWTIVRPGNVYGPGDEIVSLLMTMVRTLPAVPVIDGGYQEFQPIWAGDVADALVAVTTRDDLGRRILEIAGPDTTSVNALIDELMRITHRDPVRIPLPGALAAIGVQVAGWMGANVPLSEDKLIMLEEGNVIQSPEGNALEMLLDRPPTRLPEGLNKLADAIPEKQPRDGIGALKRKRFWADIAGSTLGADALFERVRMNFSRLTPSLLEVGPEPGSGSVLEEGETLTMRLSARGHIQVRCAEVTERSMMLITLEGHPLSGAVRMKVEPHGRDMRFEIEVMDRASNVVDWLALRSFGDALQSHTWIETVENVVAESGGTSAGVQTVSESLDGDEARRVEQWIADVISSRKRADRAAAVASIRDR